jgi:hypothetical protein
VLCCSYSLIDRDKKSVNTIQYYACLYGGQNNPGCSGYTPQPPSGYGYLHNQAANAFASGLKVDGALTLWSPQDVAGQAGRNGTSQQLSVWISPALSGTLLMQGIGGSFVRRTQYLSYEIYSSDENGENRRLEAKHTDIIDFVEYLPGSEGLARNSGGVEFWSGIRNRTEEKARNSDSFKALPEFLSCLGLGDVPTAWITPVRNGNFFGQEQVKAFFGRANRGVVAERSGQLNRGSSIVCHSNGCSNLVGAIRAAGVDNVSITRIIAVAPNLDKIGEFGTLYAGSGGNLTIVKSDGDGALMAAWGGNTSNSTILGSIKYARLQGTKFIGTNQRGIPFPFGGLNRHGIQHYLKWLKDNKLCGTEAARAK